MFNTSVIFCIVGTSGIAGVTAGGAPVQSGDAGVTAYALGAGGLRSLGSVVPYNVNAQAVPGSVAATLQQTAGGRYYVDNFVGQTTPTPPVAAVSQMPNF